MAAMPLAASADEPLAAFDVAEDLSRFVFASAPIFERFGYPMVTHTAISDQIEDLSSKFPNMYFLLGGATGLYPTLLREAEQAGLQHLIQRHAEAAFEETMQFITERKAFGQTVADFQNTRFKMADMRTEMDVAQAYVDHCVLEHNEARLTADDAANAKLYTDQAFRLLDPERTAVRRNGVRVEYLVFEDEGHGFQNEENRFEFYRAMESFLNEHLGGGDDG